MNIFRMILAVVLPPLAVWDKGCGTVLLVTLLTILFWIPGAVAAMLIVVRDMRRTAAPALATSSRSGDIFSTAQNLKSQPLGTPSPNTPFDTPSTFNPQTATPADPFAAPQPPIQRPPSPFESAPTAWTKASPTVPDDPFDDPADNPPPASQPPSRPKPPWES